MSERGAKVKGVCLEVMSTSPIDDFQYKHIDFFQLQFKRGFGRTDHIYFCIGFLWEAEVDVVGVRLILVPENVITRRVHQYYPRGYHH